MEKEIMEKHIIEFFKKEELEMVKGITVQGCCREDEGDATFFSAESKEEFFKEQCVFETLYTSISLNERDRRFLERSEIQDDLYEEFCEYVERLGLSDKDHDLLCDYFREEDCEYLVIKHCGEEDNIK